MKLRLMILRFADILLVPFVYPAAWMLKHIRRLGVQKFPACRRVLLNVGVFPIRNHYFEPQFDHRQSRQTFSKERILPGIDWNTDEQLSILGSFSFAEELLTVPREGANRLSFHMENGSFESGDAEYWYQLIRTIKPRRIFEIGSGNSTLMAVKAINKTRAEDPGYTCKHVCIEPYEQPWLEQTGLAVIRERIEDLDPGFFSELEENDILFIDSSHVIRPQGDVLLEYLYLLPSLNKGVIVHVHDIFSPRDYPEQWLKDEVRLWNEQYLLEAFLTHNADWKIIGALNYLCHHHFDELKRVAPFLAVGREPGSFYLRKIA